MNPLLKMMLARLNAPAGDDGSDAGGTDTAVVDDPNNDGGGTAEDNDRGDVVDPAVTAANLQAVLESGAGVADPGQAGEGEGAGDEEDADGTKHGLQGIPKARFNEVNTRKKELEAENEQLRRDLAAARAPAQAAAPAAPAAAPAPAAAQFDPDAKEQEYFAALVEGDQVKASKIRREINNHLVAEAEARAEAKAEQRSIKALIEAEIVEAFKEHPWLNTAEATEIHAMIAAARDVGIERGQPPHLALRAAVAKIAPKFAPAAAGTAGDPPAGALAGGAAKLDTRPAAAVKRGAADSLKQPAPLGTAGVGNRASEAQMDVEEMSDEQFANLSEAEKKKLRGD